MYKKAMLICAVILSSLAYANAQQRYKDMVFENLVIDKDLNYNTDSTKHETANDFDLFRPAGDHVASRPLMIWMHGGGFKFGSKDAKGIQLWCRTFARRGYVCAAINYTLSKGNPIFKFGTLKKSAYYAVQDAKMAVAYFRANAAKYGINPDKIILAGNSAGGIIALQAAYSNNAELAKEVALDESHAATQSTDRLKVTAVINYWGGIFDLTWLKNAKVPIVNVYGSNDGIVKPDDKDGGLYGPAAIQRQADALKIPNATKVFEGYSHELQKHFNPFFQGGKDTENRWLQAGQFTADFLYKYVNE
ncbi:alpha/beta hydrolase [Mucilaginibacter sp. KACC 22063]|uniref:alpha/beta hydrolase n=1 Tax=Mucilaginibacter sp. KACC 22063 TaxID=3025666 RepID=UPI0023666455|nr:alpha/beta hydrolase [Mucilaginibacter sp. KACC 22063]WDF55482.1 alpha/beta hydrolase [Mucilaginibacter sp. KACC 22063]